MSYSNSDFNGLTIYECPVTECQTTTYSVKRMDAHMQASHPARLVREVSPIVGPAGEDVVVERVVED